MKVLVTGTAGFIGAALTLRLIERGDEVIGIDNLNDYYDVNLKRARLNRFNTHPRYIHIQASLQDRDTITQAFAQHQPQR
ncbi:MAG: GDP-mannose 4,6-dehydratase, partial [Gammaproteobacteria bacterium]|nr:GDP-mannose 4,6-dehydratase [Gammaproteobacteria bacterium]